jgi:preprotein translocase subunit YajC
MNFLNVTTTILAAIAAFFFFRWRQERKNHQNEWNRIKLMQEQELDIERKNFKGSIFNLAKIMQKRVK